MLTVHIRRAVSRLRWYLRKRAWVGITTYMVGNYFHSLIHRTQISEQRDRISTGRVAVCLRFRDEARFLEEWLEYYLSAGVKHFFLYNNFSIDNYREVLSSYLEVGKVTLIDWPRMPASPAAEHDCVARARGHFDWVGFIDADEFVVVRDGRSIPEFLNDFGDVPGVALHWYYYGSNGHERRPEEWVIRAYTRRANAANRHFKVFVRPEEVTCNRNSHNFYYRGARCAVREDGRPVFGSMAWPPTTERAWINHYYCKSLEDYLEKAARRSTLDRSGMREPSRQKGDAEKAMLVANDVMDRSAIEYFESRRALLANEGGAEITV